MTHTLKNPFNPGGIRATLERWYADPSQQNRWVVFDGVSVILADRLEGCPHRSICLVSELGCVLGEDAHLTLEQFLYSDI
jgi:hypothetical protein